MNLSKEHTNENPEKAGGRPVKKFDAMVKNYLQSLEM